MSGHKLRILSSENDASVKVQQDQNTNITLKLESTPSTTDLKDSAPQINASPPYAPPGFIAGAPVPTPLPPEQLNVPVYQSVYQAPTVNPIQERSIDLTEHQQICGLPIQHINEHYQSTHSCGKSRIFLR